MKIFQAVPAVLPVSRAVAKKDKRMLNLVADLSIRQPPVTPIGDHPARRSRRGLRCAGIPAWHNADTSKIGIKFSTCHLMHRQVRPQGFVIKLLSLAKK